MLELMVTVATIGALFFLGLAVWRLGTKFDMFATRLVPEIALACEPTFSKPTEREEAKAFIVSALESDPGLPPRYQTRGR